MATNRDSRRVKEDGDPLELLYALSDSCMYQLSANGWKVVSYVAMQCLRLYPERDFARQNPGLAALNNDLFKMGMHPSLRPTDDRPYRNVVGEFGEAQRFAVLSLDQLRHGVH